MVAAVSAAATITDFSIAYLVRDTGINNPALGQGTNQPDQSMSGS